MTNEASSTILDVILEKASNIEHESNQNKIHRLLNEAIKLNSRRERQVRAATITIKMEADNRSIIESYIDDWLEKRDQVPATIWQDKFNLYVQFSDEFTKLDFIDSLNRRNEPTIVVTNIIKDGLRGINSRGEHFERKPVRFEISNVKNNLKIENIKKVLECITSASGEIQDLKEGKASLLTRSRNIYFRTNQIGVKHIFKTLDGAIPYCDKASGGSSSFKTKLFTKINAKPYQCRNCYTIGPHPTCTKGKLCAQCCKPGHITKDCKSKTKYCDNCKIRGHKAKDTHCPYFLNEVAKELRKMDLPLEYLEEDNEREALIKHMQLK